MSGVGGGGGGGEWWGKVRLFIVLTVRTRNRLLSCNMQLVSK